MLPIELHTSLTYDRSVVRELTAALGTTYSRDAVDARITGFDTATKKPHITAEAEGQALDWEAIYQEITRHLDQGESTFRLTAQTRSLAPAVTQAQLAAAFGRISTFSTKTTDNKNRNTNVRLSAEAINGRGVEPGESFSFNLATGERTAKKGYKPATAIAGGATKDEIGGGVCQTSSTLFNAAARANMTILSRSPHAWPSSYVKQGMDATVNWPGLDFRFRNDSEQPIYICATYADRKVTVDIYGIALPDGLSIDLESKMVRKLEAPKDIKEVNNPSLPVGSRQKTVSRRDGSVWETYKVWYKNGQ